MGTVLLVKVGGGGGGGRLRELRMADGSVEVENRKGSGMTSEHWGANNTNGVKQGTSRDTDS